MTKTRNSYPRLEDIFSEEILHELIVGAEFQGQLKNARHFSLTETEEFILDNMVRAVKDTESVPKVK
ncbi:MAG: hypothetical protein J7M18_05720 [Candidatus Eremiobacteraeota bacterium]|nr:hypothetical protein [Candidatus Eremiobacteraeota bacterium]